MKNKTVNIGIVGACGGRMTYSHIPNLAANSRARFRAFCDLNREKAEELVASKGYRVDYVTDDVDRLMQDTDIDLLVAGLPHEIHKEMILKAAAHGKDLFIEKPMVLSPDECHEVMQAVKKSGIRLMIGHNRRFAPTYVDAKRIYTDSMRRAPAILSYRVADPLPYLYEEKPEGGRIYGEVCHFFDLFAWFLESEPVKIYAEGDLNDFHITVKFDNGSRGVITSSASGGMGYPKELFECFAGYQSVIVEGNVCLTHSGPNGHVKVSQYPLFFDPYPFLPNDLSGYRQRMANYAKDYYHTGFQVFSHPMGFKGHYEELDECIDAIVNERPFSANETDGARAIICCEAAVQSIRCGLPVALTGDAWRG